MRIARVYSAQPSILGGNIVTVEADLSRGLHSFNVVGLAGKAVDEAQDRISAAIKHSGFTAPKSKNHKVVISLAPADLKKEGPVFDLPMAIAYLMAARELRCSTEKTLFLGELALDGTLRPISGILPVVQTAKANGFTEVVVPKENAREAALIHDIDIVPAGTLTELIAHLDARREDHAPLEAQPKTRIEPTWQESEVHLEDIRGQESAKRALTIAAAGRHNVIMVGPPGTGKTMLARAFRGLLPPLVVDEALEVTSIHSVAGTLEEDVVTTPPFRAPHHTASHTALAGGGTHPRPGEVTLAHRGVLFLDELPEFERRSIDVLRQPLEDRTVSIARVQGSAHFPADFILLAAMNPHRGSNEQSDTFSEQVLDQYKRKISGPIMDRMDLWIDVPHVPYETLTQVRTRKGETKDARTVIAHARTRQHKRLSKTNARTNAEMSARDLENHIELSDSVRNVLKAASAKLDLSPRSYHRIIKIAQTIADLDDKDSIQKEHVLEALQYRPKW